MSEDKKKNITEKGEKVYLKIADELRKEFPSDYYVAIEPESGEYFVAPDSLEAAKKARKKFPRKTFFGAHIGYLAGRL